MDQLVDGIAVAAIMGISFLAYKHAEVHRKLFNPLLIISLVTFAGYVIWDLSNVRAYQAAVPYIDYDKLDEATTAIRDKTIFSIYFLCISAGCGLYLMFLRWFSIMIADENRRKEETSMRGTGI